MLEIKLRFGSPFMLQWGRGSGSFVEEYWTWVGGICKYLGANAQGSPGSTPGMAADKLQAYTRSRTHLCCQQYILVGFVLAFRRNKARYKNGKKALCYTSI